MRRTLGNLSHVYESVAAKYHPESGQASLVNGHTLVITLVNVPGRDLHKPANKEWAHGVAQFAYAAYPDRKNVTNVTVALTKQSSVAIVNYSETERLAFKADELSAMPK